MNTSAFNSRDIRFKEPFGAVPAGTKIKFHIKLGRSEAVTQAKLMIEKDKSEPLDDSAENTVVSVEMQWCDLAASYDIFACDYTIETAGLYFYWFEVTTPNGVEYICLDEHGKGGLSYEKGNIYQQTVFKPSYKTPEWLTGGVMYQIFPDRFYRNGDMLPDTTQGRTFLKDWGKLPPQNDGDDYPSTSYFGGNLSGITEKLPYLKSLGVTAIYMNPIFEAHAYHRYNTADYMKIDPLLGNEDDFTILCKKADGCGIKIILDGVFSHTGADSIYFNKFGRYKNTGAYQSKDSKYSSWYDFEKWPEKYRCWWNFVELPEVNEDNSDYLNYITGENGVLKHWLKLGASGWRLDVADELPDEFLDSLRNTVKDADTENVIIGEVWEDASNKISYGERRRYLEGRQLDSVMNYPWRNAIIQYLKTGNAEGLAESVMSLLENYPKQTIDVLMNLLGSHDTIRLITCFAGESSVGKSTSWKQNTHLNNESRDTGLKLVRLASAIQYFLPGVPCVYYGDEAGFEGYEDPFNRQCYAWGEEDTSLVKWYSRLGALRAACPALKTGGYKQIAARDSLFAFERTKTSDTETSDADGKDAVILAVNAGMTHENLNVDGHLCLSFGGALFDENLILLPPKSCAVVGRGVWTNKIEPYFG